MVLQNDGYNILIARKMKGQQVKVLLLLLGMGLDNIGYGFNYIPSIS